MKKMTDISFEVEATSTVGRPRGNSQEVGGFSARTAHKEIAKKLFRAVKASGLFSYVKLYQSEEVKHPIDLRHKLICKFVGKK